MHDYPMATEAVVPQGPFDIPYDNRLYYIAAPFFRDDQRAVVEWIETLLDSRGEKYFSPREYGVILGDKKITKERINRIFDMNVRMVREATHMIAVTDDFDPGTMFEMGMFHTSHWFGSEPAIITFSAQGYGSNVMIAKAAFTHCTEIQQLDLALNGHKVEEAEVVT